jgi:protein tyrosine phosphatase (PTP) superfamily phosphohydrolase (DUF442 family)
MSKLWLLVLARRIGMKKVFAFGFLAGAATGALAAWLVLRPGSQAQAADTAPPPTSPASVKQAGSKAWAEPLTRPGIDNFFRVSNDLYRGEQPTAEGMAELKKLGVKTVVNLRLSASDRDEIGETGLAYEHIYFNPLNPEEKEVVRFLQIVADPARTPVFVHCRHGSDRTGTMCALYRIALGGWSKDEALREMTDGPFGFHDEYFQNLLKYIRDLDIEAMKRRAGVAP